MAKVEGTSKEVEEKEAIEVEEENRSIIYGITDLPPVHLGILCALQQLAMTLSAVLAVPIIITQIMGTPYQNDPDKQKELLNLRAQLVGITVFCCGVATLLQIIFGIRLPLIQGSSYTFIPVITTVINTTRDNTPPPGRTIFEAQLCELAGSLMVASSLQILLGATGAVGLLSRFIGPLSIAPILALISLGFVDTLANNCSHQWGIAGMTAGLIIIFSELLRCRIPIPSWSRGENCHSVKLPVFQILPVFLALVITWTFSAILTATNVFPNNSTHPNYLARTDAKASTLETTDWITLPYPGKWGLPTVSLAGSVGMIVATMSSIVESVGDYYAAAAICRVPPPPAHAINRGIMFEGFGSLFGGLLYASHGYTSYSGNIAGISITRVGSRVVFIATGVLLVIMGIIGKFGAALAMIPEPIIGGVLLVNIGLLFSVSMSCLRYVNLTRSRNLTVLGVAIIAGVVVPRWVKANRAVIQTGSTVLNQVLIMILGTEIILGGFLAFFLDLILPGSRKDRGMDMWQETGKKQLSKEEAELEHKIYGCYTCCPNPAFSRYLPFMPSFDSQSFPCRSCSKQKGDYQVGDMRLTPATSKEANGVNKLVTDPHNEYLAQYENTAFDMKEETSGKMQ